MKSKTTVVVKNCLIVFLLFVVGLLAAVPTERQVYASTERIDPGRPALLQADPPNTHPIMRITAEQKRAEAELTKSMPATPMDRAIQRKLLGRTEGSALSLLSHIQYTPAQRSQGSAGNCWVWAGTGVLEVALDVQRSIKDRLSIQYFDSNYTPWAGCGGTAQNFRSFYASKLKVIPWLNTNAYYQDSGRSCESGGSLVTPGSIGQTPSYAITSIGPVQLIPTYGVGQATAIANIKNILDQNKAVYFAFYLANDTDWDQFFNWWNTQDESVIWPSGYSCGEVYANGGGHAVVCVGYDDSAPGTANDYWIMLNSWGTTADRPNGLFRIPMYYDYDCADSTGDPNTSWQSIPVTFTPTAPTITNASGATDITATAATLNGNLTSNGGADTTVYIHWGDNDGGTGTWDTNVNLGVLPAGAFSTPLTRLTPGTTYYYRCSATNSAGTAWASSTASFTPGSQKLIGADDAASSSIMPANYLTLSKWTATASGNLNQVRVKCGAPGNVKVALYANSAGAPDALLGANNTGQTVVPGWNTINLPSPVAVTSGTTYWLALKSDAACYYYLDGGAMFYGGSVYANSFPDPAGTGFYSYAYYSISQGWGTPPMLTITTTSLPGGTQGSAYSQTLQATGGIPPYTWSVSGSLPAGLALNTSTGVISGTPSATGTASFTIGVTDDAAGTDTQDLSITISSPPVLSIITTSFPEASVGTAYSQTLQATGGIPPYTWSVSGSLPAGLALNDSTGVISGTPSTTGTASFTAQVTDSLSDTDIQALSITVTLPVNRLIGANDAASSTILPANYLTLSKWTTTASGNLNQVRVKCGAPGNVKVALYANSAGAPGTLLGANNTGQAVVSGWNTINLPSPVAVTSGTAYWLALKSDAACYYYLDGGAMFYGGSVYANSFPDPAGTGFYSYAYYSISQGWGTPPSAPGAAPTLLSPGTAITFKWGVVESASKYHLQVNTSGEFSGTDLCNSEVGNVTLREVNDLSLGTTYYWRVKAGNDAGWGPWSPVRSVTTNAIP